jgi:hypothetical protein
MSDTPQLQLPLLASAQAQKHVTVNEALVRLDALTHPIALSASVQNPPSAMDGDAYVVPAGATGAWQDQQNSLAVFDNGGWLFLTPRRGWRIWVEDENDYSTFVGDRWVSALSSAYKEGAYSSIRTTTADETLTGSSHLTSLVLPDRSLVIGVTARVLDTIGGVGVSGWRIGVAGFDDRYGSAIGLAQESSSNGVTGSPVAYFADTPLLITSEGGVFDEGQVRLAVHYILLSPPENL